MHFLGCASSDPQRRWHLMRRQERVAKGEGTDAGERIACLTHKQSPPLCSRAWIRGRQVVYSEKKMRGKHRQRDADTCTHTGRCAHESRNKLCCTTARLQSSSLNSLFPQIIPFFTSASLSRCLPAASSLSLRSLKEIERRKHTGERVAFLLRLRVCVYVGTRSWRRNPSLRSTHRLPRHKHTIAGERSSF